MEARLYSLCIAMVLSMLVSSGFRACLAILVLLLSSCSVPFALVVMLFLLSCSSSGCLQVPGCTACHQWSIPLVMDVVMTVIQAMFRYCLQLIRNLRVFSPVAASVSYND